MTFSSSSKKDRVEISRLSSSIPKSLFTDNILWESHGIPYQTFMRIITKSLLKQQESLKSQTKKLWFHMGEMKRREKYERQRFQPPLKYIFIYKTNLYLHVVILMFPNKIILYKCIYIYPPASFHLSIFPTLKHQGTKTLVPLEPNVLFADLKDSFRRNENPEGNREAMRLMGLFFRKKTTGLLSFFHKSYR